MRLPTPFLGLSARDAICLTPAEGHALHTQDGRG